MNVSPLQPDEVLAELTKVLPELSGIESSTIRVTDDDERLLYQEMTDVARFLVGAKREGRGNVLELIFDEVERLLTTGNPLVRDLLIVGLIEDTQNFSMQADIPLTAWDSLLKSETRRGWDAVERLWVGKMSAKEFNKTVEGNRR